MRLRIMADGSEIHVVDADSGKVLPCRAVFFRVRSGEPSVLRLELEDLPIEALIGGRGADDDPDQPDDDPDQPDDPSPTPATWADSPRP